MWEKENGVKDERVQLKCAAQVSNKLCQIPASALKIFQPVPTGFASSCPDNLQDLLERLAEMKNRSDVAAAELEDVKSKLEQTSQAKAQLEKTSTAAAAELEDVKSKLEQTSQAKAQLDKTCTAAAAELEDVKSKLEQTSQAKAQLEKTSTAAAAELEHVRSIKDEVSREAPRWCMVVLGACALLICVMIAWFAKGLATGLS